MAASVPTTSSLDIEPPADVVGDEVAIVLTDTAGSTQMAQELADRWVDAVSAHHRIIQEAFREHGGFEASNQGDGFLYLFPDTAGAVAAAIAARTRLESSSFEGVRFSDRFGVHIGQVAFVPQAGFIGLDIHKASRIMSAAAAGQILISDAAASKVVEDLNPGVSMAECGVFWLKDLRQPEPLSEIVVAGYSPGAVHARPVEGSVLPTSATKLVGRSQLLARLQTMTAGPGGGRVVTVCGTGGVGKTRLVVELLAVSGRRQAHFLDLAQLDESEQLFPHLCHALGLAEADSIEQIAEQIAERSPLIVLDNFEQIVAAAPMVAHLAAMAPTAQFVLTSRTPLHVSGETVLEVEPLPVESTPHEPLSASVELFLEFAETIDMPPSPEDLKRMLDICRMLDGLPLAIELAAGRLGVLSLSEVAIGIETSLNLLRGVRRDVPDRHRTIRCCVLWSYEQLSPSAQHVMRALSLFPGGVSAAALSGMAELSEEEVVLALEELLAHRLAKIVSDQHERRFGMLRVLREVAATQLDDAEDSDAIRLAVAKHTRALARRSSVDLSGPIQGEAYHNMLSQLDNIRAALQRGQQPPLLDLTVKTASDLTSFWWQSGHIPEGLEWMRRLSANPAAQSSPSYPMLLVQRAILASYGGGAGEAIEVAEQAVQQCESAQVAGPVLSTALQVLGGGYSALRRSDEALEAVHRATEVDRDLPDLVKAVHLVGSGNVFLAENLVDDAEDAYGESLRVFEASGQDWLTAAPVARLAEVALRRDDLSRAEALAVDGWTRWQAAPGLGGRARAQAGLARVLWRQGHSDRARDLAVDAFAGAREVGAYGELPWAIAVLAAAEQAMDRPQRAGELFGIAMVLGESFGQAVHSCLNHDLGIELEAARAPLPPGGFDSIVDGLRSESVPRLVERADVR